MSNSASAAGGRVRTEILLVSVNYKGAKDTLALLGSLRGVENFSHIDVVIVDNASGGDSVNRIRRETVGSENVYLFMSPVNRGYFGGAKWGVSRYLESGRQLPAWIIICNNDILFDDREFLRKLAFWDPNSVGVIAPRIVSLLWLRDQNPHMVERPGRWRLTKMRLFNCSYYVALLHDLLYRWRRDLAKGVLRLRAQSNCGPTNAEARTIYAPQGAFVIFSRHYFESGGCLDDGCLLYAEEISIGETCRNLGLRVVYDPRLTVLHMESRTIQTSLSRRNNYRYQKAAVAYLTAKYFGRL